MNPTIQSVKGTRDYYPAEMSVRNFIYQKTRKVSEAFGYQEYEGPFLEHIDLYAAKSGEELVKEQSFVFPDRGGDLITLRPELTPTLARMIAQRQHQLLFPLRWWSWGPFWRYERPQKGRTREFFQWNIDLIGVNTPEADAEMVAIAATFLRETGLKPDQIQILVNNRKLMDRELLSLGVSSDKRLDVFRVIDKRDKMSSSNWEAYASDVGLTTDQIDGLKSVLSNQELWKKSEELVSFFNVLPTFNVADYVSFAPHIIRGLDYYTGTIFEVWDKGEEFRAILGGGRYDNLISDVGGHPLSAIGFAMGDLVITLVLKKFNCLPKGPGASPASVLVTIFDANSFQSALNFATILRQAGINVTCYPEASRLSKQLKYADRMGIHVAVIQGPDELVKGLVSIKDLRSGEQKTVPEGSLIDQITEIIQARDVFDA
jgi:histidyl-tRNA synthetase